MHPPSIQKLIVLFSKFPTVGPRTAGRFVFYLLKKSQGEIDEFVHAIAALKKNIKICLSCFNPFEPTAESGAEFCPICSNKTRDKTLLCVVEKETDLLALEKTKKYKGVYFVLGEKQLRLNVLEEKIKKNPGIKEIIIAINPTTEGEETALHLERLLKPFGKKISRLARGLPVGGELEYADEETLSSALEGRK